MFIFHFLSSQYTGSAGKKFHPVLRFYQWHYFKRHYFAFKFCIYLQENILQVISCNGYNANS